MKMKPVIKLLAVVLILSLSIISSAGAWPSEDDGCMPYCGWQCWPVYTNCWYSCPSEPGGLPMEDCEWRCQNAQNACIDECCHFEQIPD